MNDPSARFIHGPGPAIGTFRPDITPALPAWDARPLPPPLPALPAPSPYTLTVTPAGQAFPSKLLCALLGLDPDCPIAVVAPKRYGRGRAHWHLDARPTARWQLKWSPEVSPRINRVELQFAYPAVTANLTLYLLTPTPEHPNYYPLTPHAHLAHRPTA